ncbi:hypothetical protein D3C76_794020 [compost metagenome]
MLGVDQAHGQQAPGQEHRHAGLPAEPEVPGNERRQQRAGQFGQRITFADRRRTGRTAPAQEQKAQYRNVFPGTNPVTAVWALGVGQHQIEGRQRRFAGQAEDVVGLHAPLAFEHFRQAPDQYVEEAANQQADYPGDDDESQREVDQDFVQGHVRSLSRVGRWAGTSQPPGRRQ